MTRKGWLLFTVMAVVWGIPYFFIKIAVREIDPAVVVFARAAIAAVVLLPVALQRGVFRELRGVWPLALLFSVIHMVGPFLLISFGEQHVSSSLTSLLIAGTPLMVAVLALVFAKSEGVTRSRLLGLAIGIAGLILLLGFDLRGDSQQAIGVALVLAAVVGYAVGPLLLKHSSLANVSRLGVATAECTTTTLILLPVSLWRRPAHMPSADVIASLLTLGLVCTALALLVFFTLIAEVGATRASVFTYFNPVVATALGVALQHDKLTWITVAAFALILAGSWVSTGGGLPKLASRKNEVIASARP